MSLERNLYELKKLKSEYYIGSQNAWLFIKERKSIYTRPKYISKILNKELKLKNEDYRASPERLAGITRQISDALDDKLLKHVFEVTEEDENKPLTTFFTHGVYSMDGKEDEITFSNLDDLNWILWQIAHIASPHYHWLLFYEELPFEPELGPEEMYEEDLLDYLSDIFICANKQGVRTNNGFGEFFPHYIDQKIREFVKQDGNIAFYEEKIEKTRRHIFNYLTAQDWKYSLSKSAFKDDMEQALDYSFANHIDSFPILDRILRERLDHRLEYRRQIIRLTMEQYCKDATCYEEVLKWAGQVQGDRKGALNLILRAENNFIKKLLSERKK